MKLHAFAVSAVTGMSCCTLQFLAHLYCSLCDCTCGTSLTHLSLCSFCLELNRFCRCHQAENRPLAARLRALSLQAQRHRCHLNSLGVGCPLQSWSDRARPLLCVLHQVSRGPALQVLCAPLQVYRVLALLVVLWSRSRLPVTVRSALRHPRPEDSLRSGGMHSPRWTPVPRHSGQLRA